MIGRLRILRAIKPLAYRIQLSLLALDLVTPERFQPYAADWCWPKWPGRPR